MERKGLHPTTLNFDYSVLCSHLPMTYFIRGQGDKTDQILLRECLKARFLNILQVTPNKEEDISCPKCLC